MHSHSPTTLTCRYKMPNWRLKQRQRTLDAISTVLAELQVKHAESKPEVAGLSLVTQCYPFVSLQIIRILLTSVFLHHDSTNWSASFGL